MNLAILFAVVLMGPVPQSDEFAEAWTKTESAIRRQYYAREERKEEMDALLAKYGEIAPKVGTRNEFRDVVVRMIDEFGDSHFDFLTRSDQGFYALGSLTPGADATVMPHVGAWFTKTDDGYAIKMLMEGMAAADAGLRRGDVVESVNGEPFSPVDSLMPLYDEEAEFVVRRGGETFEVTMEVDGADGMDMFLRATRNSRRIIEHEGKTFGYMHLWTMAATEFRTAVSSFVLGRAAETDGFILDLRDGFGGRPEGYADPFFRPEMKIEWDFGGTTLPQQFGYQRPLVVLINDGSRSAKEVLAYLLKSSGRATVMGQKTGGRVLGTSLMRLADWAILEIPMVDLLVDGVRLEGVGVEPDFFVFEEFGPDGEDLFIKQAVEALAFQTEPGGLAARAKAG